MPCQAGEGQAGSRRCRDPSSLWQLELDGAAPCHGGLPDLQCRGLQCPGAGSAISKLSGQLQELHVPPSHKVSEPLADQHTAVPLPPFLCRGRREPNASYFSQARRAITKTVTHVLATFTPSLRRRAQPGGSKAAKVRNPKCRHLWPHQTSPGGLCKVSLGNGQTPQFTTKLRHFGTKASERISQLLEHSQSSTPLRPGDPNCFPAQITLPRSFVSICQ